MGNEKYGVHLIAVNLSGALYNRYKSAVRGVRFRKGWKPFETAPGVFDNSWWKDQIDIAIADGLYVSVMSAVAPASNDNTPQWVFNNPYSVPFVTTDRGTYPHVINTTFVDRFKMHWNDGLKEMFLSYSEEDQQYLLCWQSAECSTGDEGSTSPYKGTIQSVTINGAIQSNPQSYNIDGDTWDAHKRANLWPYGYAIQQASLPFLNFMINPGNDFHNIEWLQANMPKAWFKTGFTAHNYNMTAEKWRQEGIKLFVNSAPDYNRMQAEGEQFESLPWFQDAPKQNIKSIFASFAAHGGDIINISLSDLNTLFGTDLSLITWANQYLGYRKANETDKGFIILRQILDFADETLYPVGTYGPVITPSLLNSYNIAVF